MSALTGIQTGPRQLEFPPNMPVFDSAGRYWTLNSSDPDPELEWMIEVVPRQRANPVRPQELILIEQVGQHPLQLLLGEERQQPPPFVPDKIPA